MGAGGPNVLLPHTRTEAANDGGTLKRIVLEPKRTVAPAGLQLRRGVAPQPLVRFTRKSLGPRKAKLWGREPQAPNFPEMRPEGAERSSGLRKLRVP